MRAKYPGTKLIGTALKLGGRMKNSEPCVHVLHKTLNLVISGCCFADDDKENVQKRLTRVQSDCFCSLSLLFCGVVVV